jgi:hypothetical protein
MTYALLGHALHETADQAKKYFAEVYGVKGLLCEQQVTKDLLLPLRPTWQGTTQTGYRVCVEVSERPFSPSLHAFVVTCAAHGMPVHLWVALPAGAVGSTFSKELKEARDLGVGVMQVAGEDSGAQEFNKPVPFSLFGLRKTNLKVVPKKWRESIKNAEDAFLRGSPSQGCQQVCQCLEAVTRRFAQHSYAEKWWKANANQTKNFSVKYFTLDSWAPMLETLDERIDQAKVKAKCPHFKKSQIAGARQCTDWRNSVSHTPRSLKQLQERDAKLRTVFEVTRDLLVDWYRVAHTLKLEV